MNIEYLREFIILADTGHYQLAADRLYISESTLSKHIKKLEAELKVPLFIRTTRKVEISKYGKLLLPYAKKIVEAQNDCYDVLLNNIDEESKQINIGSIPAMAQYGITNIVANFIREHPSVKLNIVQAASNELKEMLLSEKIEMAFIREATHGKDCFSRIPYAADTMAAILPDKHPLAAAKTILLSELADENFIFLEPNSLSYGLSLKACTDCGFTPNVIYTDHKAENIIDLVRKNMGIALLMKPLAVYHPMSGIAVLDVSPEISTQINICFLKNKEHKIVMKYFLQYCEKY